MFRLNVTSKIFNYLEIFCHPKRVIYQLLATRSTPVKTSSSNIEVRVARFSSK